MSTQSTLGRSISSRPAALLIVPALALWAFIAWQNARSAPVQRHIDEGARLLQSGQGIAAVHQWHQATQLDPNSVEAWELLSDYYLATRDYAQARSSLTRLERLNSNSPDLQARLARCAYEARDYAAAQKYARAELEADPNDVAALEILAAIAKTTRSVGDRLNYLQRLADLQPRNTKALLELADELIRRVEYDKALPVVEQVLQIDPNSVSAYFARGLLRFNAEPTPQNLALAQSDFQRTLEFDDGNLEAHRYLGRVALRLNKPQQAIRHFEAIGRGRPYASAHFLELSNAYRKAGNISKAEEYRRRFTMLKQLNSRWTGLKDRIVRAPKKTEPYLQMGLALLKGVESSEDGFELYRFRYSEKQVQDIEFYFDQARALRPADKNIQVAFSQLERAYAGHLRSYSQALKQRDFEEARRHLGRALLLRPRDPRNAGALRQLAAHNLVPPTAPSGGLSNWLKTFSK